MKKYQKLIKKVYESEMTIKGVCLPKGTTMEDVVDYISQNYKDKYSNDAYYTDIDYWEYEAMYYWDNGFWAHIDISNNIITIRKAQV